MTLPSVFQSYAHNYHRLSVIIRQALKTLVMNPGVFPTDPITLTKTGHPRHNHGMNSQGGRSIEGLADSSYDRCRSCGTFSRHCNYGLAFSPGRKHSYRVTALSGSPPGITMLLQSRPSAVQSLR